MNDLHHRIFHSEEMGVVFSQEKQISFYLDFEIALLHALAANQYLSSSSAHQLEKEMLSIQWNVEEIKKKVTEGGNAVIPLLAQLRNKLGKIDGSEFVHFGATSQDVIDTASMLQLKEALHLIIRDIEQLKEALIEKIQGYRGQVVVARTLMQQARPTLLAYKLALWLDPLFRITKKLQLSLDNCVLQLGGAVGTLSAYGKTGFSIMEQMAEKLNLMNPEVPWHTNRDRICATANDIGLIAAHLGKMMKDLVLMAQSEVGEVSFPGGSSSTMPNKNNPVSPVMALAALNHVPGLISGVFKASQQEHERAAGGWHAEWYIIPRLLSITHASLIHSIRSIREMQINTKALEKNLEGSLGLIYAENVVFALRTEIGYEKASQLITEACEEASESGIHLREYLLQSGLLPDSWTQKSINQLFDPAESTGMANELIDRILAKQTKKDER